MQDCTYKAVKDLIKQLQTFDPEALIYCQSEGANFCINGAFEPDHIDDNVAMLCISYTDDI